MLQIPINFQQRDLPYVVGRPPLVEDPAYGAVGSVFLRRINNPLYE